MPEVDFNNVEEGGSRSEMVDQPGDYLVKVAHVKEKDGPSGEYWNLMLEVLEGPAKGRITFDNLSWSERALWRPKVVLPALGVDVSQKRKYEPKDIAGAVARIKIIKTNDERYPLRVDAYARPTEAELMAHFRL